MLRAYPSPVAGLAITACLISQLAFVRVGLGPMAETSLPPRRFSCAGPCAPGSIERQSGAARMGILRPGGSRAWQRLRHGTPAPLHSASGTPKRGSASLAGRQQLTTTSAAFDALDLWLPLNTSRRSEVTTLTRCPMRVTMPLISHPCLSQSRMSVLARATHSRQLLETFVYTPQPLPAVLGVFLCLIRPMLGLESAGL